MTKLLIWWVMICLLLSGCKDYNGCTDVQNYITCVEDLSEQTIERHKQVVRWYNLNLRSKYPDIGFERSFESILCFADGMIGYVEIPRLDLQMPIYHSMKEDGFYLHSYSAFPNAWAGDESRLIIDQELVLQEGDIFYIYCLDECFPYRIGEEGTNYCELICDGSSYRGSYIVED